MQNLKSILAEKWFQGYLTNRESELLLRNEEEGSFLIRFSKSKPGSFALAFRGPSSVNHILIHSNQPKNFQIFEAESSIVREFPTVQDIIAHYGYVLRKPFSSSLPKERWFQGDLSGEEAVEMLAGQPEGTFMVRFSSLGDLAASFVDTNLNVKHVLLLKEGQSYRIQTTETVGYMLFPSVKHLVDHFIERGVFSHPYKNLSSIFTEERPARESERKSPLPPSQYTAFRP